MWHGEAAVQRERKTIALNADKIIRKMHLAEGEKAVLDCYLCGMGHSEIARYLNVNRTTVWNRRNELREKYLAVASGLNYECLKPVDII